MAVLHARIAQRIPHRLAIKVVVMIDEPRRDDASLGVNNALGGGAVGFANTDDPSALHCHIRHIRPLARTVDDAPIFDKQIERHFFFLLAAPFVSLQEAIAPGVHRMSSPASVSVCLKKDYALPRGLAIISV